jgi:hypothetical protein
MTDTLKGVAWCCLAVLIALYIVGAVSHGSLRHVVQTLPLWFPIVMGFNRRELARWCALPCLCFWLGIMVLIWLFLLGWAHVVSGQFSPVEIAMTLIVGIASAAGLGLSLWWARWSLRGVALIVLFGILQCLAFRISLLPAIAQQ